MQQIWIPRKDSENPYVQESEKLLGLKDTSIKKIKIHLIGAE